MVSRRTQLQLGFLVFLVGGFLWLVGAQLRPPPFLPSPVISLADRFYVALSVPGDSVLAASPGDMRAAYASGYRLAPDRRFLRAIADIHAFLSGQDAQDPEVVYAGKGQWSIRYRGEPVGTLPELADYGDWEGLLTQWVQHVRTEFPQHVVAAGGEAEDAQALAQFDALAALRVIGRINKRWQAGVHAATDLHAVARALTIMHVQRFDQMETADSFTAATIAAVSLDKALAGSDDRREEALLATSLGQSAHAKLLVANLPEDDVVRLYVERADDRLRDVAAAPGATPEARYLYLVRLAHKGDQKKLLAWYDTGFPGSGAWPVLTTILSTGDFDVSESLAPKMPVLLVRSLARDSGHPGWGGAAAARLPFRPQKLSDRIVERFRNVGIGDARSLTGRLEAELADLGERTGGVFLDAGAVGDYYRAGFYSALYRDGMHRLYGLSSARAGRDFAETIATGADGLPGDFRRWYDDLIRAKQGIPDPKRLLHDLTDLETLGVPALNQTFDVLRQETGFTDPLLFVAVKRLASRMDDRIGNREILAIIAEGVTLDLPVAERLYRSVVKAGDETRWRLWLAHFTADKDQLLAILGDASVPPDDRIAIPGFLQEFGASVDEVDGYYRGLVDAGLDNWSALDKYVHFLEDAGRFAEARDVVGGWLAHHDENDGFPYIYATTALAREYYREGRYEEGLAAVQPVVASYQSGALGRAALLLERSGRTDAAEQLARAQVERYPDSAFARSTLMEIYWRNGKFGAAASVISDTPYHFGVEGWREEIGRAFVEVFRDNPGRAVSAFDAMIAAGISPFALIDVAAVAHHAGQNELAYRLETRLSAPGLGQLEFVMSAYEDMKIARGDAASLAWLRTQIPPVFLNASSGFIYEHGQFELLWTVTDPPVQDDHPEAVWLARAAAWVRMGRPPQHAPALAAYYAQAEGGYYYQLGRYLMGLMPERDMIALATTNQRRCEVSYYLGVRAEGEGRYDDASDWFHVVLATGRTRDGEYRWAYNELVAWNNRGRSLSSLPAVHLSMR